MKNTNARARVEIEHITPLLNGGLFPVKRVPGDRVKVGADLLADGHDLIGARLLHRKKGGRKWLETVMVHTENDRWEAAFTVNETGFYEYAVLAWVDHAASWLHGFTKKLAAGENMETELLIGATFLREMAGLKSPDQTYHAETAGLLENKKHYTEALDVVGGARFRAALQSSPLRTDATQSQVLQVIVERKKALFSAWYEFFPRSASPDPKRSGTFADCEKIIPRLAKLGFDTLYFPPIHPIGVSFRKGKNNSTTAKKGEPGSPWAIGNAHGGHKAINPELGTLKDFEKLIKLAQKYGIEIAMDLAYQCSPDHPYVKEHPQWFRWRPDGTVQYAENPPKKYQDVLPINFENDDWQNLWNELKSIVEFWIGKGIRIFRVDNPHTKPFVFWEWLMAEMRRDQPDVIFLSEAFTRPKIMGRLAKVGFQQSYTYFTWRQTKAELTEYLTELTQTENRDYFRPNFWPNTPDILPYYLQKTGYSHSAIRYVLAATLSSNYGMYGPVYELLENNPVPGKEEYLNSEKYEVRHWDWKTITPFHELIRKINLIRKENTAFHSTFNIECCETDNEQLIAYYKEADTNKVLTVVNLDPLHKQSGWVKLPAHLLPAGEESSALEMQDLLNGATYHWNRQWNYVELDPKITVSHIFLIHPKPSS